MHYENKEKNRILSILSIIKIGNLLFVLIGIINRIVVKNLPLKQTEQNFVPISTMLPIVMIIAFGYAFWYIAYSNINSKRFYKKNPILEDSISIIALGVMLLLTNSQESQYKFLLLFNIISATIAYGKNYGIIISIISSVVVLSIDLIFNDILMESMTFQDDFITCGVFVTVAWILGAYVNYEKAQRKVLEMEVQVLKLKEEARTASQLLQEQKEYNKLVTEFFSNISHELKTPLNIIFSSIQMLLFYNNNTDEATIEKKNGYLAVMKQNSYRLLRLINNILDTVKFDSGFAALYLENADIVNTVEDIVMSIVPYAQNKGINIIFDTEVEELVIAFDTDKIERIVLNLLSNALKFTNAGGEILIYITKIDDEVSISVKDNGIGIQNDKLEFIFQRFGQVDKTFSRNHEGTGIGLSLVKSLVDLHGGSISINSKLGFGSDFIINLPIRQVEEKEKNKSELKNNIIDRIDMELSDVHSKE